MRSPRLAFFAFACAAGQLWAASFDDRVAALFRPPLDEMIALSPDGARVAYTNRARREPVIVILNLAQAGPKHTVKLNPDASDPAAAPLRFLRWATPNRLVFAPAERVIPLPPLTDKSGRLVPNPDGPTIVSPILVVDADGKQTGTLVDARDFQETPEEARRTLADLLRTPKELATSRHEAVRWRMPHLEVIGFLPREREQLVIETRGAYSMPTQHLVDLRNGHVRLFGGEWPSPPREPQVFDWFRLKVIGERQPAARPTTAWRDAELDGLQRELEAKFPRRAVEMLDWSETRHRVLFRVTGGSDAGRLFVFQRPENLPLEILRRAPWLKSADLHETRFFEFAAADGARLSGYVTWPRKPQLHPPPLLVVFPSGFPGNAQPVFDPEAQVFAGLGFVVARLNHRCVAGVRAPDFAALHAAIDRVSVGDTCAAVEWIATHYVDRPFDRRRVVTLGRGFGGYLAMRALQIDPAVFRCGVAIDAPLELPAAGAAASANLPVCDIPAGLIDAAGAKNLSVLAQVDALTNPVLLLVEPVRAAAADELCARLQAQGRTAERLDLDPGFVAGRPKARATVYRKIDEFLQVNLYGYAVKLGAAKEVE